MKSFLIVIGSAAIAALVSVVILKSMGVEAAGAVGGGVGGAVGALAGSRSSKKSG